LPIPTQPKNIPTIHIRNECNLPKTKKKKFLSVLGKENSYIRVGIKRIYFFCPPFKSDENKIGAVPITENKPFCMKCPLKSIFCCLFCTVFFKISQAQNLRGVVQDAKNGEALIGATLIVKGTSTGCVTDFDGQFDMKSPTLPATILVSYSGYLTQEIALKTVGERLKIDLQENAIEIKGVEIVGQRISEKQRAAPLTVETLDAVAVKETAQASIYNALGNLKGVDLTTASLGFTIINTRGFNSTSPVRSLQIIDGVDNQAPGLNFSLGNFLGSSDLDIQGVDLIVGASSAFYGPNAFNGVISMNTKSPFNHRGLAASVKYGERNLTEGAIRYADSYKNKNGNDYIAFKVNLFHLRANDWVADNFDPVFGTATGFDNPGGRDKVNVYGDEYSNLFNYNTVSPRSDYPGLGTWHRSGYKEADLVDYGTRNYKASAAVHFRTHPSQENESPELIFSTNFGSGTTVYQGDNRFSLRGILFFQNRLEYRKKDKWFIRAYATKDDAGKTYDPYFTALRLQNNAKSDRNWASDYAKFWADNYRSKAKELGYPQPSLGPPDPITGFPTLIFDLDAGLAWEKTNANLLTDWHEAATIFANTKNPLFNTQQDYYEPGTPRFQAAFDSIRNNLSSEGGTRFYDKSALYHLQGERKMEVPYFDAVTIGGSSRMYTPISKGTIFSDTSYTISSLEMGAYLGAEKEYFNKRLRLSATVRADKNFEDLYKNIDGLDRKKASYFIYTPAASMVFKPKANNFFRLSFSSALRNPTLTDKYLRLNVGRAILSGNLQGVKGLATIPSYLESINGLFFAPEKIKYFDIKPVRPEQVRTLETGYRTTLFNKLYVDAGYYFSFYKDFLGYNIGLDLDIDTIAGAIRNIQPYRYAANSTNRVTTQGFSIGLNYYFGDYYGVSGNYSWNRLNSKTDDPIIPAFNTPENKFNLGLSGRDLPVKMGKAGKFWGWNITYKWIEGFQFEGSPQFTGNIPTYDMLDAQVNCRFSKQHLTLKLGGSNVLNKQRFQAYGGPRIGRMIYSSLIYDFFEKN
jgi:iron complex outermembrane recepter protein